jgi:hypothetical protein
MKNLNSIKNNVKIVEEHEQRHKVLPENFAKPEDLRILSNLKVIFLMPKRN